VPDPGDQTLVEERLANLARLIGSAKSQQHLVHVGRVVHYIRPEPDERSAGELQHRSVPEDTLRLLAAEDEPGKAGDSRVRGDDLPAALHAQVAAQDNAILELEEQVLADRAHLIESEAVDSLGNPQCPGPGVLGPGPHALSLEHPQPLGGPVQAVSLGHVRERTRASAEVPR